MIIVSCLCLISTRGEHPVLEWEHHNEQLDRN